MSKLQETMESLEKPIKLYICDRNATCAEECQAKILGRPIDDDTVCQRTSEVDHSLSIQLGISPSWSTDPARSDIMVETTEHIFNKLLVIPVTDVTVAED